MTLRIALVAHQLPPRHLGGVEVYTWTLAQRLVALGHEVAIFCPTDDRRDAGEHLIDGITMVRPWRPNPRQQPAPLAFWHNYRHRPTERAFGRFLHDWRPTVLHVQHLQWVSAQLIRQSVGLPTVLTLHDYWFICPNSQLVRPGGRICLNASPTACAACLLAGHGLSPALVAIGAWASSPAVRWRNRYVKTSALRADLLLTPSQAARDLHLQAGFPAERLRVFCNGLDPRRFPAQPAKAAHRDHAVFGYLGGLSWQKGVHVLLEAFASLAPQHELRVYGPLDAFPDYADALRRLAQRHPGIHLLGPVAPDDVGVALAELDYLVVPSLWPETFGMVAQEAHYMGVPVIASRIGALERIRDGVDGRLFEAGNVAELARVLEHVAANPGLRSRYATQISPGPTIDDQALTLVDNYRQLLRQRL
jgi:glycosyltransferase involved in cell wall biosynthesis